MPRQHGKTNLRKHVATVEITAIDADGVPITGMNFDLIEYFTNVTVTYNFDKVDARAGQDEWKFNIPVAKDVSLDFSKVNENVLPLIEIANASGTFIATIKPSGLNTKSFQGQFALDSAKWGSGEDLQSEDMTASSMGPIDYDVAV